MIWHPKFQKFPRKPVLAIYFASKQTKTRSTTPQRRTVAILELAHANLDDTTQRLQQAINSF